MQFRTRALSACTAVATAAVMSLLPAAATAQAPGAGAGLQAATDSYELVYRSFTQSGHYREYTVALPASFDESRHYPIVLAFGGWGDTAASYRDYAGLEQAAAGEAIIVYAQGVGNAWAGAPYAATSISEDVTYARSVVQDVVANFSGDADRVWATGMSNGGGFAAALSCRAPGLVDAVASVAGAYYQPAVDDCSRTAQVPTMIIHGTDDELVAYQGGDRHGAPLHSVDATMKNFATRNGCTAKPAKQAHDYPGTTTLRPARCQAATEILRVDGGTHTWFYSPSAAEVVWDFFSETA